MKNPLNVCESDYFYAFCLPPPDPVSMSVWVLRGVCSCKLGHQETDIMLRTIKFFELRRISAG